MGDSTPMAKPREGMGFLYYIHDNQNKIQKNQEKF
jgi:hypothetical protein